VINHRNLSHACEVYKISLIKFMITFSSYTEIVTHLNTTTKQK